MLIWLVRVMRINTKSSVAIIISVYLSISKFSFHWCADPDEISDHKRKFISQIRKGIVGKIIVTTVNRNPDLHQAEGGVHAECQ
jgi:hypothetical protein